MRLPVHTVILPPMLDSPVLTESQVIAHAFAMGKVGLLPTDTLWGLSGLAVAEVAQRIQSLKHRDEPKPLILLVDDLTCMSAWLQPLTESQQRFCARHWPGPVTVLLPVTEQAPSISPLVNLLLGYVFLPYLGCVLCWPCSDSR